MFFHAAGRTDPGPETGAALLALHHDNGTLRVDAARYHLIWHGDGPFVTLQDAAGSRVADLFALSGVHSTRGLDDTVRMGEWRAAIGDGVITVTLDAESAIWDAKRFIFECYPDRFRYRIVVEGRAAITEARYFGGYYSGSLKMGTGFFMSGQAFREGFNPEPSRQEVYAFPINAATTIDLTGTSLPGREDWFFTPPPFCYAFLLGAEWLGIGVEARPGENRFTAYSYEGRLDAFALSLDYEGQVPVDGVYELPALGFDFAPTPYAALERHVAALERHGCAPPVAERLQPAWWREPIFCGWGAQCGVARREGGRAPDYARQPLYDDFIDALARNGIYPGTIVLDDKWQATYGENRVDPAKWPDLPGFIARQHAAGRRVLLWLKAWDPEGLPIEACVTNAAGLPVALDPTSPLGEQALRESVRVMLGEYGADGFKIDFSARIPSGPALRRHGDAWGLELMKAYLGILYDEAKRVRPDALVMAHTPHPYLSDCVDMIRLNDINMNADVNCAMQHRAHVVRIACPGVIIDTDNWPVRDRDQWRAYVQIQNTLGVPALYFATEIDRTGEPLTGDDYHLIRETWAAYRALIGSTAGRAAESLLESDGAGSSYDAIGDHPHDGGDGRAAEVAGL